MYDSFDIRLHVVSAKLGDSSVKAGSECENEPLYKSIGVYLQKGILYRSGYMSTLGFTIVSPVFYHTFTIFIWRNYGVCIINESK